MKNKILSLLRKIYRRINPRSAANATPSRIDRITKFINKNMRGIEVAPYHSPIAPKKQGFNCLTLDVFDTETLLDKAKNDPNTYVSEKVSQIENVDIVSSAVDIENAVKSRGELGSFDYVISSHNFEHLPNPIKFLQGCGAVLKPGGVLSMAIPDKRKTFDFVRSLTTTTDFLEAFHNKQQQPSPYQLFEYQSSFVAGFPENIQYQNNLSKAYEQLLKRINTDHHPYVDSHVSVFTAQSFLLIITECILLRLIPFSILEIEDIGEFEFYVHLKNTGYEISEHTENELLSNRTSIAARAFGSHIN